METDPFLAILCRILNTRILNTSDVIKSFDCTYK